MTGLSESTVRVHLFRAMKKLRDLLGRRSRGPTGRRDGRTPMNRQHGASHPDEAGAGRVGDRQRRSRNRRTPGSLPGLSAPDRRLAVGDAAHRRRACARTADDRLTETFLSGQRDEVMRRLRGEPRARVIRFPAPDQAERAAARVMRPDVRRWVAAAARVRHPGRGQRRPPARSAPQPPGDEHGRSRHHGLRLSPSSVPWRRGGADEAFLVELDTALVSRGPEPLRVLDAMTPERDPAGRPR